MKAIGSGGEWWWNLPSLRRKPDRRRRGRRNTDPRGRRRGPPPEPLSSSSSESIGQSRGWPIDFPFTQAVTAASLTLTGDTIAQVRQRIVDRRLRGPEPDSKFLDQCMPKPTFANLSTKVILNQIALGPCVIGVIFAWNNLWTGKLSELPSKYRNDALPTLLFGWTFEEFSP
uniref:Uncharacterized protein n=1 Tax=Oryza glumipatula TaxID=40148 RepID=A0A0D9YEJ8_9ORYZ